MIIQSKEVQAKTSLIDLLGGNSKSSTTKSSDLFSKLLATLSTTQQTNDFKAIIDPKTASLKTATVTAKPSAATQELQSLLSGSEQKDSTLFSKELISTLSNDQVRTLINRAKEYLKTEITAKSPDYQNETKSLPKTLAGLVKLADKMGLDPQSITLSVLKNDSTEQPIFTPELLSKPLLDAKIITQLSTTPKEPSAFESITQLISELKTAEQKESKSSSLTSTTASDAITSTTASDTITAPTESNTKTTNASAIESAKDTGAKIETQPLKALLQHLDKRETSPSISAIPLEEAKAPDAKPLDTKPMIAAVTPKTETLITLLQGESEPKEPKTDRITVSKTETEAPKTMQVPKADSIEVKSKEAQQSMRLFASDLKEAVQEYKPPFTRLTMKLNPEKLGEVEVTLIQRGNNVHVNIQSNNTNSVAFLAHNATELKTQLANQGISNATMNFMSGGEGQNGQTPQQKQQEQQQNRFRAYESLKDLELNNEQLSALEIIIPHYA